MKKMDIALLMGIIVSVVLTSFGVFAKECDGLKYEVMRLHIVANSDSDEDQWIKYKVRDALMVEGYTYFSGREKETALKIAEEHLKDMERIAIGILRDMGHEDQVKAELVNMYFGTRIYDGMPVAAGWYDAVRVTIGEGGGENWWCVMFPPMCLPAASGENGKISLEQDKLEQLGQPRFIPKFAVIELMEQARNRF